jgi:hypothetical protein
MGLRPGPSARREMHIGQSSDPIDQPVARLRAQQINPDRAFQILKILHLQTRRLVRT